MELYYVLWNWQLLIQDVAFGASGTCNDFELLQSGYCTIDQESAFPLVFGWLGCSKSFLSID